MSQTDLPETSYNPFDPETIKEPFSRQAALRAGCPVHFHPDFEPNGFFTFFRFEEVDSLFREVDRWSADWGQGPIYVKEGGLKSDPPTHTIYRRLITGAFTGKRTAAMEPAIAAVANELIDGFIDQDVADLMSDFASLLPTIIVARMIGVPMGDIAAFKTWSDDFMASQNSSDPEVQASARARIDDYFRVQLTQRRAEIAASAGDDATLPDDILTSLLLAEHEGRRFADDELLPLLLLLLVGGNETTASLIGSLVLRLLDLGLWEEVAADSSKWDVAIEETLRFDPPVLGLFRTAKGDQTVEGVQIPDEAKVMGLYSSANRDDAVWDDPDTFRLDRDLTKLRSQNMAFGRGIWLCPAAALARLEARVSLQLLAERLPGLSLAGEPGRVESFMMWGPTSVPVKWEKTRS
ncbi:MAG TPA: cytochrome P450 [Nocardioidaceae bacterium]|nr:cytochrome P450 [Nocardioidaceae bacterium]